MNPLHEMLAVVVRDNPSAPLLTYYDEGTGERVELSATTTENWVAKTANLLQEEFDVGPGSTAAVSLPPHWQSIVLWLALWRIGGCLISGPVGSPPPAAPRPSVVVLDEAHLRERPESTPCLALSLAPMARGLAVPVPGVTDYASEVSGFGDYCPAQDPVEGAALVRPDGPSLSFGQAAEQLHERAGAQGLTADDRVLIPFRADVEADPFLLLSPLAAGASLVLLRRTSPAAEHEERLIATERVTRRL